MLSDCLEIGAAENRSSGNTELLLLPTHQALLPRTGAQVQSLSLTLMTVTVLPLTSMCPNVCTKGTTSSSLSLARRRISVTSEGLG